MSFWTRTNRVFANTLVLRRVVTLHHPRAAFPSQRAPWGHDRISAFSKSGRRSYHSGYGSGAGSGGWDGLVYSIMANIRGRYDFGSECFYSALDDTDNSTSTSTSSSPSSATEPAPLQEKRKQRRDIRHLIPLQLPRRTLSTTASDIHLRLTHLSAHGSLASEHAALFALTSMVRKLSTYDTDDPLLSLAEYREIWMTLKQGLQAANETELQMVTYAEYKALAVIEWNAAAVWGTALVNAALRGLVGRRIVFDGEEGEVEGEAVDMGVGEAMGGPLKGKSTFDGDLRSMALKVLGLLLDSKDHFPEGERWFTEEQEVRIMEAVVRVWKEAGRRGDL
ncbi:hypothetical protein CC80DRAFT_489588 [Byssothecium circinans]|uniref:Uncharacterized protein n=1 Tax=Byssothecium circinans TaxID=147558 RepID=A0A6A5U6X4_9PLEO|nr:hypothetical protein CC80DRAFT_489588 [Byssothecium circinans]